MWKGLSDGLCRSEICDKISQLYNVSSELAHTDYDALTNQLLIRQLLEPIGTPQNGRVISRPLLRFLPPLTLHAWLCQISIILRLRYGGFSKAYDFTASRLLFRRSICTNQLDQCLSGFVQAENFSPRAISQQDCLPRSLSLFIYLIERGFAVRHIIGIADDPLRAHGWVELEDTILLDSKDRVQPYASISCLK